MFSAARKMLQWSAFCGEIMYQKFKTNIIDNYGEKGDKWLERLDDTVQNLAEKWSLTSLEAFPNLTFNYVASALRGAEKV